jgi:hypothetical protein
VSVLINNSDLRLFFLRHPNNMDCRYHP